MKLLKWITLLLLVLVYMFTGESKYMVRKTERIFKWCYE